MHETPVHQRLEHLLYFQVKVIIPQHLNSLSNLKSLNLNKNKIQKIENYMFMALRNLLTLAACSNRIAVLEHHSFYGLHKLNWLMLEKNYIKEINLGDLSPGILVDLAHNQITQDDRLLGLPHENPAFVRLDIKEKTGTLFHVLPNYYHFFIVIKIIIIILFYLLYFISLYFILHEFVSKSITNEVIENSDSLSSHVSFQCHHHKTP